MKIDLKSRMTMSPSRFTIWEKRIHLNRFSKFDLTLPPLPLERAVMLGLFGPGGGFPESFFEIGLFANSSHFLLNFSSNDSPGRSCSPPNPKKCWLCNVRDLAKFTLSWLAQPRHMWTPRAVFRAEFYALLMPKIYIEWSHSTFFRAAELRQPAKSWPIPKSFEHMSKLTYFSFA